MGELWRLTAIEAVRLLKRREVSPLELIDAAAARIEATNPEDQCARDVVLRPRARSRAAHHEARSGRKRRRITCTACRSG